MWTDTPGAKLRALREQYGRTQLWVEVEGDLGTGYLQRVESGRVVQPGRPTLERVLGALRARYPERRQILEAFRYTVATLPPDEDERAWACAACQRELCDVPFPAYALDCTSRLVAWNGYLPRLLGVAPDDALLGWLAERPVLAAWCDPCSPLAALVVDPDTFLPALIRALRYELQQIGAEAWVDAWLTQMQRDLPRFRHYWDLTAREPALASAARACTRAAGSARREGAAVPALVGAVCAGRAIPYHLLFPGGSRHHAEMRGVGSQGPGASALSSSRR